MTVMEASSSEKSRVVIFFWYNVKISAFTEKASNLPKKIMRVMNRKLLTLLTAFVRPPSVENYNCSRTAPLHPAVHNFGNTGILGALHARFAWLATKRIDEVAYEGRNMRRELVATLNETHFGARVLEVGCGAGTLTYELVRARAFQSIVAVDVSNEMIDVAKEKVPQGVQFRIENGVDIEDTDVDVAIACMVAHEMPLVAHRELAGVMLAATRNASGEVWFVDIDPSYIPSVMMLSGEPYVERYLSRFNDTLFEYAFEHGVRCETFPVIDQHVRAWVLKH